VSVDAAGDEGGGAAEEGLGVREIHPSCELRAEI
jgi:hypothetical protein